MCACAGQLISSQSDPVCFASLAEHSAAVLGQLHLMDPDDSFDIDHWSDACYDVGSRNSSNSSRSATPSRPVRRPVVVRS